MKEVWKYKIEPNIKIDMPKDSEILCVQTQFKKPCIWVMVNPNEKIMETREIEVFGTGHKMSDNNRKYIGTFQVNDGMFVFHVFEKT